MRKTTEMKDLLRLSHFKANVKGRLAFAHEHRFKEKAFFDRLVRFFGLLSHNTFCWQNCYVMLRLKAENFQNFCDPLNYLFKQ